MKKLLLILFSVCAIMAQAQSIDTVIDKGIYQSYFNKELKQPVMVAYKLYHAGGECSRAGDRFKNDAPIETATQHDYDHSGYDEGHLADSKDFAYDCAAQEATFRFYNCVPQTPNLNRGIWKHWESIVRDESNHDSLLVIAGGSDFAKIGQLEVPAHCWKVVRQLINGLIVHVLYCTNTNVSAVCDETNLQVLCSEIDPMAAKELRLLLQ